MNIQLKPINMENKISSATNYRWVECKHVNVKVFPIPEWLQNALCDCKSPAKFIMDDKPTCSTCLTNIIINSNTLCKEKDISIPLTIEVLRRLRYEWSVTGEKWYGVKGKNIIVNMPVIDFFEKIKPVLLGTSGSASFEGDYDKEKKTLIIEL